MSTTLVAEQTAGQWLDSFLAHLDTYEETVEIIELKQAAVTHLTWVRGMSEPVGPEFLMEHFVARLELSTMTESLVMAAQAAFNDWLATL